MAATNILITVVTVMILTGMLSLGIRSFNINDTVDNMKQSGWEIDQKYAQLYASGNAEAIGEDISVLSSFESMDIFLYDKFNALYYSVECDDELLRADAALTAKNNTELLNRDSEDSGYTSSNESNIYSTPVLSVSVPLKVDGQYKGCVIMHKRLTAYEKTMRVIYKRLIFCMALAIVLAIVITRISYKNTSKTLKDINTAAMAFARGDFSKRVTASGSDEIYTLAETYNTMADELKKYEDTRQGFVANVSHELRSPITSIQGFAQGMLDGTIDESDRNQYLQIVLDESKRMSLLIHDLLDLAKIESGQFPLEMTKFDICEELRRTLINFVTKIDDKNIEVTVDIPDEKKIVLADKRRVEQVLINLIDNAVKFCEKNGTLKIWTYETDGRIHVNISNSGAHIPEEDLPFVFDRFFKVDKSHTKKSPGTGIGLSIVNNIILQHGEKIWVNSRKGTGTVFTFTLRLSETPAKTKKRQSRGEKTKNE